MTPGIPYCTMEFPIGTRPPQTASHTTLSLHSNFWWITAGEEDCYAISNDVMESVHNIKAANIQKFSIHKKSDYFEG